MPSGEAKPIPNEILFSISQMMKGNPDKPEGKLLNALMPSGIQSWLEQVGLGNKPGYLDRLGAGMDIADFTPGILATVGPKALSQLKKMFEKPGGVDLTKYSTKIPSMHRTGDKIDATGFLYKNAPKLSMQDVEKLTKEDALKALLDDTPSSIHTKSTGGDSLTVAVNNEATHMEGFQDLQRIRNELGEDKWPLDEMTAFMGKDYNKRIDGYLIKHPTDNKVRYADRRVTAALAEKGFGVNLFPHDNEAESILLNMMKRVIKKAKLSPEELLDFADVLGKKKSPYEVDYIKQRMDDVESQSDFKNLLEWTRNR